MFMTPGSRPRSGRPFANQLPFYTMPIVGTTVQVDLGRIVNRITGIGNGKATLIANSTLGVPTGFRLGQSGMFKFTMDGTGSRTLTPAGSIWCYDGDSWGAIGTTANKSSLVAWQVLDMTHILLSLVAVNVSAGS